MSVEAAVKLPLAVRKARRDLEPKQVALASQLSELVGSAVEINVDFDAAWVALEGHADQAQLPAALVEAYLPQLVECLNRGLQDELVKKSFLQQFKGQVTFSIVDDKYEAPKDALNVWNLYNGLRFVDGKLDLYTKKDRFFSNVQYVGQIKLSELMANQPGALPLSIRIRIRDETAKRNALLAKIATLLGIDQVTWNIEEDAAAFHKIMPTKTDSFCALLQYMEALEDCLSRHCKDELVKEAVVDAFSAKRVSFKIVPAMKKLTGLKLYDLYNGIQIEDGVIYVVTEVDRFFCNVYQIGNLDLISMF